MNPSASMISRVAARHLQKIAGGSEILGVQDVAVRLTEVLKSPHKRVVLYYRIEDVLPLALVFCASGAELAGPILEVEFLCDDTYGGRVSASLLTEIGLTARFIHWSSLGARAQDVHQLIRSPAPLGLAVDGHGPYGMVGRSFSRFLKRTGAVAVPLAAGVSSAWHLRIRAPIVLPRHGTRVCVGVGDLVRADSGDEEFRVALQRALDAAGDEVAQALVVERHASHAGAIRS